MKVAVLGANWSPCAEPIDQAVVPAKGLPSPSVQLNAAPPHSWTSIPRCFLYQACNAGASFALKKMPPMPVTRFMEPPRLGRMRRSVSLNVMWGASSNHLPRFHVNSSFPHIFAFVLWLFRCQRGDGHRHIAHFAEIFAAVHEILVACLARHVPGNLQRELAAARQGPPSARRSAACREAAE